MTSIPHDSNVYPVNSTHSDTSALHSAVPLIARILMSVIFLLSGFGKATHWAMYSQYMTAKGMPMVSVALAVAIIIEIGGGLSLLLGVRSRLGALILALFLIPTTVIFHKFWGGVPDAMDQQIHFLKNVAIIGGLLMIFGYGPGSISVDHARRRA